MNPPPLVFEHSAIKLHIDVRVHRLTAIKKTAYRLAAECTTVLGELDESRLPVTFLFKDGTTEAKARAVVSRFFQELVDQDLREEIAEETAPLRTLILAHAFSRTGLIRDS